MNYLQTGHFFGNTNRTLRYGGLTLTDTVYTHPFVDWHYHENAYFTFILQGELVEGNKKESYHCTAGSLLFHSWQEPHYNIKPEGRTRGFHIEFDKNCCENLSLDLNDLEGSFNIENPDIKFLLYKIFRETKIGDDLTLTTIQMLLGEVFGQMLEMEQRAFGQKPLWTKKLKEILHDDFAERLTLKKLSHELNLHPAHLSRDFSKHFHCTFGEYVRKLRVERALALLPDRSLTLTEIAYHCGFADQSHFLRCFKKINGATPSRFRKLFER